MPNLKDLKKKRALCKAKLTQFEKYLLIKCTCERPNSIQLSELGGRLQKMEECYGEYDSIQIQIESLPDISDTECQDEYTERERFETQYFAAVGKAREDCKSGPCRVCSKKHNTTLHLDEPVLPQQQSNSDVSQDKCVMLASQEDCHSKVASTIQTDVTLSSSHNGCVLLSTALIDIVDYNGTKHTVRCLLDNGSTSNFITESISKRLNLPIKSTSITVEGLNQSIQVTKRSTLTIISRTESYVDNIDCLIVPRITQLLPITYFNISDLNIPSNLTLADPNFNIPLEIIDILLNAEILFFIFLYSGKS
ncbi:hypothetical protein HF086_008633 [Spodoptera exigua]|uniref:Peptidase aspartic putative domain-containing protein n=1 Tax=Spodoptera exigua TaxID=7107 RepID=A0A922M1Q4_SPOEX|nr:hypothetical protein HF086_008633 [Spodoptera exigua]